MLRASGQSAGVASGKWQKIRFGLMARERVQSYTVHERADPPSDRVDRADALTFVRDGLMRQVVLAPPVWFAVHRVWLGVLAYVVAAAAILAVAWALLLPGIVTLLAFVLLHLLLAGEADEMLRARLAARGWNVVGQVTGTSRLDCERRFYDQWLPSMPLTTPPATAARPMPTAPAAMVARTPPSRAGNGVIGNLLAPLRRRDRT